jgi:hypothetical protein
MIAARCARAVSAALAVGAGHRRGRARVGEDERIRTTWTASGAGFVVVAVCVVVVAAAALGGSPVVLYRRRRVAHQPTPEAPEARVA